MALIARRGVNVHDPTENFPYLNRHRLCEQSGKNMQETEKVTSPRTTSTGVTPPSAPFRREAEVFQHFVCVFAKAGRREPDLCR